MKRFFTIVLVLAACGDNLQVAFNDARMGTRDGPRSDAPVREPRAVAVAGDFMSPGTGTVSKLELRDLMIQQNISPGSALGDPTLRYFDGRLYIINRFGSNNITILNAQTMQLEEQMSTGANSNPQDVAVVGNKLYVPALGTAGVVVLTRGSATTTTIDLSSLDTNTAGGNDSQPDCVSAYAVGTKVYVACGVLRNFVADQNGKVGIIDTMTDTLVGTVTMNYRNPVGWFEPTPLDSVYFGDLLIPTVPSFTNYATGCVERISTGATPTSACGLTNAEMGGFANRLSVDPVDQLLWIAVDTFDTSFNATGKLRGFDLESGTLWPGQVSGMNQLIVDVAACPGGNVVATDQTLNMGGLRVFRDLTERTTAAISIGMPPTVNALACYHQLTQ